MSSAAKLRSTVIGAIVCVLAVGSCVCDQTPFGPSAVPSDRGAEQRAAEARAEISELARDLRERGYSNVDALAVDVFVIRSVERALKSNNLARAGRGLWSPKPEHPEARHYDRPWDRSPNFGVTRERKMVRGESLACELEWFEFRGNAIEWRTTCAFPFEPKLVAEYVRHTFALKLNDFVLRAEGFSSGAEFAADAFRSQRLGVVLVEVPHALRTDFDRVSSPWNVHVGLSSRCGLAPSPDPGPMARIADAGRFDVLRAVLRGPNPPARVLAGELLLGRDQANEDDRRALDSIVQETPTVWGCAGCVVELPEGTASLFGEADARGRQLRARQQ